MKLSSTLIYAANNQANNSGKIKGEEAVDIQANHANNIGNDLHPNQASEIASNSLNGEEELGFTGLCSVIPLFKALFVTVLSQLENTPLKTEKISFAFLQRSTQLIGLFICADIFPRILSNFQKILSNSTNFEAFVLMRDLWDFLKLLIPTCEEITKGKMISFENKTVLEKKEGKQLISSMVLVIQRNISLLGEFLYPILELIGENDENDWTIEREQKPISVLAEIKRL
uniref:Integrator complex subunit 5 C-terminal domain-containing protein n=2 Tax=Meloidogyne TaxID=189290 RepID=A0A915PGG2_9BILA